MKISLVRSILLLTLAVLQAQMAAGAAEEYTINLSRDYHVGQKMELSIVSTESTQVDLTVNGKPAQAPHGQNKNLTTTLEGSQEILELRGRARSKIRFTVKRLVSTPAAQETQVILEPGTSVLVSFGEKEVAFSIDGKAVAADKQAVLAKFFETEKEGTDDDELLGTKEKQAVGGQWKIDRKAVAAGLTKNGMGLAPEDVDGWMKVEAVVEKDGVKCLDIRGEIDLKRIAPPMPPGIGINSSGGKMSMRGLYPVDGVSQPTNKVMTMIYKVEAAGDTSGVALEMSMAGKITRDAKVKEVK